MILQYLKILIKAFCFLQNPTPSSTIPTSITSDITYNPAYPYKNRLSPGKVLPPLGIPLRADAFYPDRFADRDIPVQISAGPFPCVPYETASTHCPDIQTP